MALQNFNELNVIQTVPKEIYFGEMELPQDKRDNRIELARQLEDVFMLILTMFLMEQYSQERLAALLAQKYRDAVSNFAEVDEELGRYIDKISATIMDTTERHRGDEQYTSYERAVELAEEESNTTMNYLDYKDAVAAGYTMKEWVDVRDRRERDSHLKVGGTQIPIDELFTVGESKMRFPKDAMYGAGAEEIVNCRCTIRYF